MGDHKLAIDFSGVIAEIARFFGLAHTRTEPYVFKLAKFGVDSATLTAVPADGESPVSKADIETVEIHFR